jgi:hypothetical protein
VFHRAAHRCSALTGASCLRRQSRSPNLVEAAHAIVRRSGVAGLYRGNLVNVLRSAPQKSLDFFAFDLFKVRVALPTLFRLRLASDLSEVHAPLFCPHGCGAPWAWDFYMLRDPLLPDARSSVSTPPALWPCGSSAAERPCSSAHNPPAPAYLTTRDCALVTPVLCCMNRDCSGQGAPARCCQLSQPPASPARPAPQRSTPWKWSAVASPVTPYVSPFTPSGRVPARPF